MIAPVANMPYVWAKVWVTKRYSPTIKVNYSTLRNKALARMNSLMVPTNAKISTTTRIGGIRIQYDEPPVSSKMDRYDEAL
jgi:hypothetical protein